MSFLINLSLISIFYRYIGNEKLDTYLNISVLISYNIPNDIACFGTMNNDSDFNEITGKIVNQ